MMMETQLQAYGMAGIFIAYLIYDRQVVLKGVTKALNDISEVLVKCKAQ